MAAELSAFFTSGDTALYFILNRQSDGYFWNTTDTDFEEGINTSWTAEQYGITATEVGGTERYQADMPSGISAGIYTYILYQRQGAKQSPSDYRVSGIGVINWDGTQDVGNQAIYSRLGLPAGASVSADIAAMRGATFDTATDSLEAIRNRGDAAWVAATGFPDTAAIADRVLGRNLAGGSDGGRTLMDALRFLRNRWTRTATTLTVYQEDDTTVAWTSTLTVSAGTNPVTESNPA